MCDAPEFKSSVYRGCHGDSFHVVLHRISPRGNAGGFFPIFAAVNFSPHRRRPWHRRGLMASIQEMLRSQNRLESLAALKKAATSRNLGPYGIWSWMSTRFDELPRRSLARAAHQNI